MFSLYATVRTPTQLITKAKVKADMTTGEMFVLTNRSKELHHLHGTITHTGGRKWTMVTEDGVEFFVDGDGRECQSCGGTKVRELAP